MCVIIFMFPTVQECLFFIFPMTNSSHRSIHSDSNRQPILFTRKHLINLITFKIKNATPAIRYQITYNSSPPNQITCWPQQKSLVTCLSQVNTPTANEISLATLNHTRVQTRQQYRLFAQHTSSDQPELCYPQ